MMTFFSRRLLITPSPPADHHKVNLQIILFDGLFYQRENIFFKLVVFVQKKGVIHGHQRIFLGGSLDESFSGKELNFSLLKKLFQSGPLSFQGIPAVFKENSGSVNEPIAVLRSGRILILFPLLSKYKLLGWGCHAMNSFIT